MDSNIKFLSFLESIKTDQNKILIEAISNGYQSINSLYETPDSIDIPGVPRVTSDSEDSKSFIYLPEMEQFYISKIPKWHIDLMDDIIQEKRKSNPTLLADKSRNQMWELCGFINNEGKQLGIFGRLWLDIKVLSFWDYPDVSEFKTILSYLTKHNIPINDDWRVEVYMPDDVDSILIPIGDYSGKSASISDIRQIELDKKREQHTLSPIEKEKEKKKNPNKELPVKKVDTGGLTTTEYNFKKNKFRGEGVSINQPNVKLESPDSIDIPNMDILTINDDEDARAFIYLPEKEKFYISKKPVIHRNLINDVIRNIEKSNPGFVDNKSRSEIWQLLGFEDNKGYPIGINGRLWLGIKAISFWDYPSVDEFKKILGYLTENGIPINNKWRVEVYLPNDLDSTLIPIGNYTGKAAAINNDKQMELDKKRDQHILSPMEKEKQKRNTPTKELPVKNVDTGGLTMAEYNFNKNKNRGE